ncbi:MAG TPA: alkaline phosphatase, partial [candidate division Zixibacteria bacterium]|nr:alkaline phosphatase [candidate division Zixibacteria bacterium]
RKQVDVGDIMDKRKYGLALLVVALMAAILVPFMSAGKDSLVQEKTAENREVKNVIIMISDGMGLADVTAARMYKNGPDGASLYFETLENIGYQRTYAKDSIITDSSSAGSAMACGEKFNDGEICFHNETKSYKPSVLELAKEKGKATGIVATSTITHATPAAFAAHSANRRCENEIARQYVQLTEPDVMLGGGVEKFNSTKADACKTSGDFITEVVQKGYSIVYTEEEMNSAVANGDTKLLGLFNKSGMTPEYQRLPDTTEPRLPEMTSAALDILEKDNEGFFVMVEGSQVDWGNHAHNLRYQIGETLAFDEAVKVVLDWINASSERKEHTLLIITSDHETGGFAINGPNRIINAGEYVEDNWTSPEHTAVDTIIWSQGPGSEALGRAVDNTDIYMVMAKAIGKTE